MQSILEAVSRQLRRHEAVRLKLYKCPAGKLSIGVGRNLEDVGISEAEADFLLQNDLARVCRELDRALPWWTGLDDARRGVLINMAFNLGITRFLKFRKTLAAIQGGNYSLAATEMLDSDWADQVGRRAVELSQIMRSGVWPEER